MKILFIPNWNVTYLSTDDTSIQAPDKKIEGHPYWFFKYFPDGTTVDVIGIGSDNFIRKIERKIKFYICQPFKAFLIRNRYDIVISHGAQSGLVYELLSSFCKRRPLHIMFDIGGLNGARINHTETPFIRFALRRNPVIIVHASKQLDFYRKYYPNLSVKTHFIPFGTDFDYFSHNILATCSQKRKILSFGYSKRDYSTLCEAFHQAKELNFELQIIGETSLSEKYSSDSRITFHSKVSITDLIKASCQCSFVVVPLPQFLYSYGQMSFLQSMALGKALIVSRVTSSIDYIGNAPGVIPVAPYDIEAMSSALRKLCALSQEELDKMGQLNSQYVHKHFSEESMGKQVYSLVTSYYKPKKSENPD